MKYENPLFDPECADDTPVTIKQVIEYAHTSRNRMYALIKQGKLPYIKGVGREILFRAKDVKDLVNTFLVDPTTPELPDNKNQPTPA